MADTKAETRKRCLETGQILRDNWIGAHRAHICSINEFKHWHPSHVEALFKLLPDLKERKLSPHGPQSRPPPTGTQHLKEFALKAAMIGLVDVGAVTLSPFALVSKTVRKEWLPGIAKLNVDAIGSSFFVSTLR